MKSEPIKYTQLLNMAEDISVYTEQRGYYYGLHAWNDAFKTWCMCYNNGSKDIPFDIMNKILSRHQLFQEYFSK